MASSAIPANDAISPEERLAKVDGEERISMLATLVDELRNSDPKAAIRYGEEGLKLLATAPNPKLGVDIRNEMSWAYRVLGDNAAALSTATESAAIAETNGYAKGLARAFNNAGGVYYFLGDYELALEYSLKALEIRESSDDQDGIAASLSNIGLLNARLGNTDAAIENYGKALAISEQTGNTEYLVNHLHNLGDALIELKRHSEAESHLQRGLTLARETGYRKGEVDALASLGRSSLGKGDLTTSGQYLKSALLLAQDLGWRSLEAEILYTLAQVNQQRDQNEQAIERINLALTIASELDESSLLRKLHRLQADLYESTGRSQEALSHFMAYSALSEKLFNRERQDKISFLQARFEAAERTKEIALLREEQATRDLELQAAQSRQRNWQIAVSVLALFALAVFVVSRQHAKNLQRRSTIAESYEKLLQAMPLGVLSIDGNDQIRFTNDNLLEITEHQTPAIEQLKVQAQLMLEQQQDVLEWELPLEGRPPKSLLLAISQREDEHGAISGFWLIATDLTAQKSTQAQLIQASKLATLGEMSTGMAHELNQPLNIIALSINNLRVLIQRGKITNDSLLSKLLRIDEAVTRAAAIIDHMRAFGRVAGDSLTQIDVREVIRSGCDLITGSLELTNIKLTTRLPDAPANIMGNAVQLEQVLLNLISNAKDAILNKKGAGDITVCAELTKDRVIISVTDTGGGIPEHVLPHLFEPFFTTKAVGQGTGLGGSISYGIVRDMQGEIWAENVDGGARLNVSLPLAR